MEKNIPDGRQSYPLQHNSKEIIMQLSIDFTQHFDGCTYDPARDHDRLAKQLGRVYDYMSDGLWHSLAQISRFTGDPEASVSARLRDLKKPRFGGYNIDHKHVKDGLWVYRMWK